MAKRFTDTDIWDQDWFIELPNKYKLLFNYLKDKCDNAGIWRPNKSIIQKIIGEPLNLDDFLAFVNADKKRIATLPSGRWFLRDFFIFQYGDKFSATSHVHKGAFKQLVANGVHPAEILGSSIGEMQNYDIQQLKEVAYSKDINILKEAYTNPYQRVKDKDKDKDKDKAISLKGGVGENKLARGSYFDLDKKIVRLDNNDATTQLLGKKQLEMAKNGELKAQEITEGEIY